MEARCFPSSSSRLRLRSSSIEPGVRRTRDIRSQAATSVQVPVSRVDAYSYSCSYSDLVRRH